MNSESSAAGAKRKLIVQENADGAKKAKTKSAEADALKLPETLANVEAFEPKTEEELDKMLEGVKQTMDQYCASVIASRDPKHLQLAMLMFFGVEGGNAMFGHPCSYCERVDEDTLLLFRDKIKWVKDFASFMKVRKKALDEHDEIDEIIIRSSKLATLVVQEQFNDEINGEVWRNPCETEEDREWERKHFYNDR